MLYKDTVLIKGGAGGDGCVSFRREKYVALGGPDGGDGGNGGSVFIVASRDTVDLGSLGGKKEFVAGNGQAGGGGRKHGKKGEDLAILVPVGTLVFAKADSGGQTLLADLSSAGKKVLVAKGGKGGLGNARFATAVNQAPRIATKGEPGEERHVVLELRLVTDICIVGQPNSGKSTLLSAISRARPEIAEYPFTTRQPVLGVMPGERRDFIVAEIPALIDGSHLGKGLGNEFLRHAERTKLLIYLLDGSSLTILEDLNMLDKEIASYEGLCHKAKIVAVNKIDLPEVQGRLPELRKYLSGLGMAVFYISALKGEAVLELTRKAMEMVEQAGQKEQTISQANVTIFRPKPRQKK